MIVLIIIIVMSYRSCLDISQLVFRHFFEVSCSVGLQALLLLLWATQFFFLLVV